MNAALAFTVGWAAGAISLWVYFAWSKLLRSAPEWRRATGREPEPWDNEPVLGYPRRVGATSCCDGTGFADYAAVPCPNPSCPTKRPQ